jgi:hypothetical protein
MDRLHPDKSMGKKGRNDPLQEHPGARMEQSQEPGDGKAAPRPLLCWLAERVREGGSLGRGASRALDENHAMAMPPPFVPGGSLHGAAETLEEASEAAQRECGKRLTGCRRRAPQARPMGQMTAGGVAMQHLPQEALHSGDRRAHAVAPCGRPALPAHRQHGFGWPQQGPFAWEELQDGGPGRDQPVTSSTRGALTPGHTGEARRLPTSA